MYRNIEEVVKFLIIIFANVWNWQVWFLEQSGFLVLIYYFEEINCADSVCLNSYPLSDAMKTNIILHICTTGLWMKNTKLKKKIWMMITGEKETVHSTPFILFEEFPCKCNGKEKPGPCFWPFGMWFNLSRRKIRPLRWYPHGPRFYSLEIKHMLLEK